MIDFALPPIEFPKPAIIRPATEELLRYGGDPMAAMLPGIAPVITGGATPLAVAASNNGSGAAANTHTINLPSGIISGNLLLMLFTTFDGRAFTPPSGWTTIFSQSNTVTLSAAYKVADGSEGATTTCTTASTGSRSAHVTLRITGYQATPQSATATGSSTGPNPPSLSPSWGTASETLFIAGFGNRATSAPSGIPANYADLLSGVNGSGPVAALATRIATLSSDDPGAFTSESSSWVAGTIAVRAA